MKIILDEFDRVADMASTRHASMINAIVMSSRRGMVGHSALSPIAGRGVKRNLVSIGKSAIDMEEGNILDDIESFSQIAVTTAFNHLGVNAPKHHTNALSELLKASEEASSTYLLGSITSQVNSDVNQTLKDFRNAALRAMMKSDLNRISRHVANDIVLREEIEADRRPKFTDRVGRRISSDLHIRREWRKTMRDHFVQAYLQTLTTSFGISEAIMWHPDVTHGNYGRHLAITEPDYGLEDIGKALHPNARALPVAQKFMEAA